MEQLRDVSKSKIVIMVIMMKMGCFLMNEARIIRSLPSTDIGRGCVVLEYHVVGAVGNSAVPLSSAALKQPASPEGGFRLAKRTPDGGLGRTYSRSSLCNDPLHGDRFALAHPVNR